ncbi:MAG: hypothetical protein HYT46_02325 [Candidatus Vogelbacteria bacterium]|nr:hypothetical protein [Candidatus Vogelbacteria bacterium]
MKLRVENYQRLFSHPGLRFLINEIAMMGYCGSGVVSIVRDDDFVCYIPKATIEQTSQEGLNLYGSWKTFDEYLSNFRTFQQEFLAFCQNLSSDDDISKKQVEKFVALAAQCINFYKKTEFIYTDRPYLESQRSDNQELNDNLKRFETIKFEFRDFINAIFFGQGSFYQKLLEKLGKKFAVSADDLQQYRTAEIFELFNQKKLDKKTVDERFRRNIIIDQSGQFKLYWGQKAEEIIKNFLGARPENKEIKGTIVYPGKITGRVVIIRPAWHDDQVAIRKAMEEMNQGDILVSETTSPDIMPAIKKAGAIVTDQGGLMSHAAIMSRELKVPGIVGCGNATQILKDGMMVEVDAMPSTGTGAGADKGIVRIMEK